MKLIDRLYALHKMYPAGSDGVGIGALVEVWEALPKSLEVVKVHKEFVAYCEDRFTWSTYPYEWE